MVCSTFKREPKSTVRKKLSLSAFYWSSDRQKAVLISGFQVRAPSDLRSNSLKGVPTAENCLLKSMRLFGCDLSEVHLRTLREPRTSKLNTRVRFPSPLQSFQVLVAAAGFHRSSALKHPDTCPRFLPRSRTHSTLRLSSCMLFERDNQCSNGSNCCFLGYGLFC
jgi:hypothetical protein